MRRFDGGDEGCPHPGPPPRATSMAAPFDFYPAVGQAVEARLDGVWRSVVLIGSPGQDELTWTVCPAPPGERHASDSTDSTVSTVAEAALEYIKAHRQTWLSWLQREKLAGHGHDPARHAPETVQRFHAAAMAGWAEPYTSARFVRCRVRSAGRHPACPSPMHRSPSPSPSQNTAAHRCASSHCTGAIRTPQSLTLCGRRISSGA